MSTASIVSGSCTLRKTAALISICRLPQRALKTRRNVARERWSREAGNPLPFGSLPLLSSHRRKSGAHGEDGLGREGEDNDGLPPMEIRPLPLAPGEAHVGGEGAGLDDEVAD